MQKKKLKQGFFGTICFGLIIICLSVPLSAAEYPEQPIEIIAPFGAGSSTDRMTLAIIPFMERELKQKVLPSYRSGGGGNDWDCLARKSQTGWV